MNLSESAIRRSAVRYPLIQIKNLAGYKNLKVWEISHELTLEIYKITQNFPKEETYGLVSQMRRAAYSIPANIVEGKSRESQKEFMRFLIIARASSDELSYFILLAKDLEYIDDKNYLDFSDKCSHIGSMINNLLKKIRND